MLSSFFSHTGFPSELPETEECEKRYPSKVDETSVEAGDFDNFVALFLVMPVSNAERDDEQINHTR
jgi:hypothetical protein